MTDILLLLHLPFLYTDSTFILGFMTLAVVYSRASNGVKAPLVSVETHISGGLPGFSIVGLPEAAVRESRDRVRSAVINSKLDFPVRKITVNLAPADLPKQGGRFDLPIAIGILAASGQLPLTSLSEYEFVGELALTGELRPIYGTLPVALAVRQSARKLMLPTENGPEAILPGDNTIFTAKTLEEVYQHLSGVDLIAPIKPTGAQIISQIDPVLDIAHVRGQAQAKRALMIAAAGGHSLLMIGPPGTGKTMLAQRLPGIMPALSLEEALEITAIYSLLPTNQISIPFGQRPFRSPHHTSSGVALVGGGTSPKPGEISLAHHGILFLDELPEFNRHVLEVLREPLESGTILISRAARKVEFPAQFQLIAAMNPCPCGYLGSNRMNCRCTTDQIARYRSKLSGPLLDRIDIHIEVGALPIELITESRVSCEETSETARKQVHLAVHRQRQRGYSSNAKLTHSLIEQYCILDDDTRKILQATMKQLGLSARAYHRVLKIARTIADLDLKDSISRKHILEAIMYRKLDRPYKNTT